MSRDLAVVPEVRLNDDGGLDEVVAKGASFHLEQMDTGHWWLCVECGGRRVDVWLHAPKGRINASYQEVVLQ